MNTRSLLIGAATGSAAMFLLDPNGGRRRRALVRDQATRATRKSRAALDATARDVANRTGGVVAATKGRLSDEAVNDARLVERVRAKLGRVCSHPRAIDVTAHDGHVTLRGPILSAEVKAVLARSSAVRGVRSVDNELEPHETAEGIPALQGDGRVEGPSIDILQNHWSPATRAMVGAGLLATGALIAVGARRGSQESEH